MTHTLHREGTPESLEQDFLLLVTPAIGRNDNGSGEKLKRLIDIIFECGPANYGCYERGRNIFSGVTIDEVKATTGDRSRIRCVFSDKQRYKNVLKRIAAEDLGLSVTASGLVTVIEEIAAELHLKPHSANLSLGIHGNRELLPVDDIRRITTMCGHGMIAPNLVKRMLINLKKGRLTSYEAAIELAKPCVCGVFNPERAANLLDEMLPVWCMHYK
jgi:hypothetical protein